MEGNDINEKIYSKIYIFNVDSLISKRNLIQKDRRWQTDHF